VTPVWLIEGGATAPHEEIEAMAMRSDDQRLSALAAAVRDHEIRNRHTALPARPQDLALYRRLRQICGER
jgi:hypothetical protein